MKKKPRKRKEKTLSELAELAMKQAARKVIEENKRFCEPLIVWENGKVRKIPLS